MNEYTVVPRCEGTQRPHKGLFDFPSLPILISGSSFQRDSMLCIAFMGVLRDESLARDRLHPPNTWFPSFRISRGEGNPN